MSVLAAASKAPIYCFYMFYVSMQYSTVERERQIGM